MADTATAIITRDEYENPAALAGFGGGAADRAMLASEAGAIGVAVREEGEIKAAIVLARQFPRMEATAYNAIIKSCDRPGFAECCTYRFPRGGQQIEGPSVDLARELARCWGNIRYGLRIVSEDDKRVHIKGYAFDLETNNYVEMEDKFAKLVQRKNRNTGKSDWVQPDERDLRELINRRGAILVRNAILQLIPPDITEDAVVRSKETMRKAAAGSIKQDRKTAIRRLVGAFDEIGVSPAMLEGFLKHALDIITEEEMANLRSVWKSISDGNSRREEYFSVSAAQSGPTNDESTPTDRTEALAAELSGKKAHASKTEQPAPAAGAVQPAGPAANPEPAQQAPSQAEVHPPLATVTTVELKDLNKCAAGERVRVECKVKRIVPGKEVHVYHGATPVKHVDLAGATLNEWVRPDVACTLIVDVREGGKFSFVDIGQVG